MIDETFDPFGKEVRWFRGLSRAKQWLYGVPIIVGGLWVFFAEILRERKPDEPQQAFWFTLILFVVTLVLSELLRPKPPIENARPKGLGDFQFPTATEGRVVPVIYGLVLQKGPNVIDYGDLEQDAIREKVKTGLWSSTTITKGFRYVLYIQFAICRGFPDVVLRKVRIGEKVAFSGTVSGEARFDIDEPEFLGGDEFGAGGIQATVDFYPGNRTQTVSPFLDKVGRQRITTAATPTAPRYTGTSYVVVRELTSAAPTSGDRGAYFGNSTTIQPWSFEVERFPGLFPGQPTGHNKIGTDDCNPINVIYEALTNTEWGYQATDAEIDIGSVSSFRNASDTMRTELNGFSMILDQAIDAKTLIEEVSRQIDGVVFEDITTGKWTIQLVRAASDPVWGYNTSTVPQFDDTTIEEMRDFTRGSWDDVTNQVQVKYDKRIDEYKESYANAQNMANAIQLAGGNTLTPRGSPSIIIFPGVKNAALASNLSWRELRGQSRPLARATFVVNQVSYTLKMGGVFAWTDPRLGFNKLAMRVTRIDYGRLQDSRMIVTAIEDAFEFAPPSFGVPTGTGWVPPAIVPAAYPTAEQHAEEAPRALVVRDPQFSGDPNVSKVFATARRQGGEVAIEMRQRNASGAPAGTFAVAGDIVGFMRIGELDSALGAGEATVIPTATITIVPSPDAQSVIEQAFDDASTLQDLGVDLVQLILVGTEFMLVQTAAVNAANVDLQNVYRAALDSAQANHADAADVFLVFLGANVTDTIFPNTNNVDIKLLSRTSTAILAEGLATTISLTMAKRTLRPYPPAAFLYNGSGLFGAPALEGDGAGLNGVGFDVDVRRRRFDTLDEVAEMGQDNTPEATTEHRVRVFVDPLVGNDLAYDSGWFSGIAPAARPTQAQIVVFAAAGTLIRVQSESRHDILAETDLESRYSLIHDATPTSARSSQFYLGGNLRANDISNSFVVATAGVHNVTIGAAYSTSNVQHRINGGTWTTIIAASGTTGATASLSISDTIELRHTANETPDPQFVEIDDGSSDVAYGCFSA